MAGREQPEGGDAACWLDRTCPVCGHLEDGDPPAICPRCGFGADDGDAPVPGNEHRNRQATVDDDASG